MPAARPVTQRLWEKVEKTNTCWLWTASTNSGGYGVLSINGHPVRAHRIAYELLVGPIPEGLTLDHLCRVRHCVNPAHLQVVTSRENTLRGESTPARNARKTHCQSGHEFTPENTTFSGGRRYCRTCRRDYLRAWRAAA